MQIGHWRRWRPGRRGIALLGLAVLALLVALVGRGLQHRAHAADPAAAAAPVPVVTAPVAVTDVPIFIDAVGNVLAAQSVTVRARVDGQLEQVAFTEGQDVRQGDLLARIDARPYQAQLEQAQAQKARDEASLANAIRDLERYTMLAREDSIPQQTLDTQQATVGQLRATVLADQAQIDSARVQLDYTTIRAPVSGRTGARLVDAGNIVHAADSNGLVVINQIDPIAATFTLPENRFPDVNRALQAGPSRRLPVQARARDSGADSGALLGTGYLTLVNNQIDTSTGTIQLKALFPNPSHSLWPGQFVNLRLQLGTRKGAATVPQAAIQHGPAGLYVYAVSADGAVAVRPVRVEAVQDGMAVIEAELGGDARVVVDGQYRIKPGSIVVEAPAGGKGGG